MSQSIGRLYCAAGIVGYNGWAGLAQRSTVPGHILNVVCPLGTEGQRSAFVLISQQGGVTIDAPGLVLPTALSLRALGVLVVLMAWLHAVLSIRIRVEQVVSHARNSEPGSGRQAAGGG